ncbi:MAG: pentapeptide repeat-containing protein [Pseudonocardiaceae bacterium]
MKDSDTRLAALLVKGPFAATYFVLLVLGGVIAGTLYWGIAVAQGLDPLPRSFNAQQSTARLDALRTSLTTVGGAAAVAGLYLAYRRQRNNEVNSARELDKVFTDRLVSLYPMLISESSEARLLGLDFLVRLADDSDKDRATCLKQLCSYLRSRNRIKIADGVNEEDVSDRLRFVDRSLWLDREEWDVRRAAAESLAQRLKASSPRRWTDSVDLREAILIDVKFADCTFEKDVNFRGAILADVNFDNCTFEGTVDFRNSVVTGTTSFAWTTFNGTMDWRDAIINTVVDATNIYSRNGLNFDDATFNHPLTLKWTLFAKISLESAIINAGLTIKSERSSEIGTTTQKINLQKARIRGPVKLPNQAIDVRGADFSQADPLDLSDVKDYYLRPDIRGLVYDETTKWPTSDSSENKP